MVSLKIVKKLTGISWIIFSFLIVLIIWQTIAWLKIFPNYLFPSPASVLTDLFAKVIYSNTLLFHIKESLVRLSLGYAVGIAGGLVMGIVMGLNKTITRFLEPLLDFAHAIPGITWLPIAILWLGIGYKTVVFIILLAVFFPILYGTLTGLKTMSLKFSNVALMCGAKKWQIIAYVLLPGAMPSIINGIRIGAAYGWRGLVAAEMIAASSGIGWMIIDARSWLNTETVILGAIIIGILWLCMDRFILKTIETKTIERWGMIRT
jgi:NitT/TauT family transport system permease protein/taurine transport system permease protein